MPYHLYNSSSEHMSAVGDAIVDLIVGSPPYNIGTTYSTNTDVSSVAEFHSLLRTVFGECMRVLKPNGKLIVESADTVYSNGVYTSLSGLIQQIGGQLGLSLVHRHISFTLTERGVELPEHGWEKDFTTTGNAHSNCHQLLVFEKSDAAFDERKGQVLYYNYPSNEEGHPCPSSPIMIEFILSHYFNPGDVVLEPFMGTGRLGRAVVQKGGTFLGYELEKEFFDTAQKYFEELTP